MKIHNITIRDFKSLYGEHSFNFDNLKGLIKLSGPIGSGKTSLCEAIIYGLYGSVKDQNNRELISWNAKACEVEMNLTSKDKDIHIIRNIYQPLIVEINGKTLSASNKRDTQSILEEEFYDVPKLAVTKMCVISFSAFNSLASMNPNETKIFLDEIFGFKLFSDYNDEIVIERKTQQNELLKLNALYEENINQIEHLNEKRNVQKSQITDTLDIDKIQAERKSYVDQGVAIKKKKEDIIKERDTKAKEYDKSIREYQSYMTETMTLGKQAKEHYNTFKSGICPTCGQQIDQTHIDEYKNKYDEYIKQYREWESKKITEEKTKKTFIDSYNEPIAKCDEDMSELRKKINNIDTQIKIYDNNIQIIDENYDELIQEYETKANLIKQQIDKCDLEIGEWNEMNELFSKTLRYNLLETLIPHINKSIQFFINKLDQSFKVQYDQMFKAHIFVDGYEKEISYKNLSTGQRKTLDLAIIFGILQNIIANVDFNVYILDELFSNMDTDIRNTMLTLLKDTLVNGQSVFVINHAEMADDLFAHKIKVSLVNKKIQPKKKEDPIIVKCSKYEYIY